MGQYSRDFGLLLGMTGKAKAGAVRCDRTIKIQPSVCSQFGGHRGGYAFGQRCTAKHRMFCHRLKGFLGCYAIAANEGELAVLHDSQSPGSDERRGGKECVSAGRAWGVP